MTNDGMLSQEEIDALLSDDTPVHEPDNGMSENNDVLDNYLSPIEQDAMGEIGNIAFGSAATALSTLLNQKVDITTPKVSLVNKSNLSEEFPIPYVSVLVTYTEGFEGSNVLMIKTSDAKIIADIMLGGDGTNPSEMIDDIHLSAVQEAMNQMMGSSATSMSTVFNKRVDISPPSIELMDVKKEQGLEKIPDVDKLIKVSFNLRIGNLVDSNIMQLIPIPFVKQLVHTLLDPDQNDGEQEVKQREVTSSAQQDSQIQQSAQQSNQQQQQSTMKQQEPQNIQPVSFANFETEAELKSGTQNLDLLLDIPLNVTVELGKTKRTVKDILEIGPGSIVELDKLAGEPVDILINHKRIAKGEVVVIDENFGVRVTEILSQKERLQKLN